MFSSARARSISVRASEVRSGREVISVLFVMVLAFSPDGRAWDVEASLDAPAFLDLLLDGFHDGEAVGQSTQAEFSDG